MQQTTPSRPFPLPSDPRPDPSRALARSVVRAGLAALLAEISHGASPAIAEKSWPGDGNAVRILTKAATAPATTTTAGWAAELSVPGATAAFFQNLQVESAAAHLFAAAIRLPLEGSSTLKIPFAGPTPTLSPSFTAEGAPIPVRQALLATVQLGPARAMRVIATMTNEIADYSVSIAEQVIRSVMVESAAKSLDVAFFSNTPADATRPAGILVGVVPIAATAGGGLGAAAADVENLVAAIVTAGGGRRVMLFLAPGKAAALSVLSPGLLSQIELVPTPTLPADDIVAIDPGGILTGYSGEPIIEVGRSALLHMEDTAPLQFSSGPQGSATVAAPSRSMFQTDSFALRLVLKCAWAGRPGFVQTVSGVTW
jgi:hypothetical protein